MRNKGVLLIFSSIVLTGVLFVMAKDDPAYLLQKPFLTVSQISALVGTIFFSYTFFLASRFSFLENIFGGLDKVYKLHQITGRLSFIFLASHFIFLVFNYIKVSSMLSLLLLPGTNLSYSLGILGLWSMSFILCSIIYIALDYQWFVRIQSFFIIPFTFGVLHLLLIPSDSSQYLPLTILLLLHAGVGYISWIYRIFLYQMIGPRFEYEVEMLNIYPNDVVILSLVPVSKKMPFLPGQFVYVKFDSLGIKKESHPFSLASSPFENNIRLAIKASGDFTTQIRTLKIGQKATLMGPYGRFFERFFGRKDSVCIAGGIGVTPFLGLMNFFKDAKSSEVRNMHLFYSVRNEHDTVFLAELQKLASVHQNVSFKLINTERDDRLNVDMIRQAVGELKDKLFFLCGPKIMMEDLSQQLKAIRIPAKDIFYEDFSFK